MEVNVQTNTKSPACTFHKHEKNFDLKCGGEEKCNLTQKQKRYELIFCVGVDANGEAGYRNDHRYDHLCCRQHDNTETSFETSFENIVGDASTQGSDQTRCTCQRTKGKGGITLCFEETKTLHE